jgi:hypothetical protein
MNQNRRVQRRHYIKDCQKFSRDWELRAEFCIVKESLVAAFDGNFEACLSVNFNVDLEGPALRSAAVVVGVRALRCSAGLVSARR